MAPVITNRLLADAEAGEYGGEEVGVVMLPVMVPRWVRVSRRSWATKSEGRPEVRPSMVRCSESAALVSVS